MNYKDLLEAIEKRPGFFLRNQNLDELDAFLRGISYMNFVHGKPDQFSEFYKTWFPRTFPQYTHDWRITLREMSQGKDEWQLFFEIWNRYLLEREQEPINEKALLQVLTELNDYEEASVALLELSYKNPLAAKDHCKKVLENQLGDIYYRAMVVDISYNLDRNFTLEFVLANLDRLPEYMLAAALSNVIEDQNQVPGSGELQEFVSKISEYLAKASFSSESEPVFLKFISTFKKPLMLTFDEIIIAGRCGQINESLNVESIIGLFGNPEIFTRASKSYPTMLVYNDLEFRLRNNQLEVMTICFSQHGALVPAPIDLEQFQTPDSRHFTVIEALLKQQQVQWKKDEVMSDTDQDVYITEHQVHLAFHEGVLTKIGVVYR